MFQRVDEYIAVVASFSKGRKPSEILVHYIKWKGVWRKVDKFGLCHPERRGTKIVRIIGLSTNENGFRIELDPETLLWKITEIYTPRNLPDSL